MFLNRWLWPGLVTLLALSCLLSVSTGPVSISLVDALSAVLNWATQQNIGNIAPHEQLVVNTVRLPRTLLALAVGATLDGLYRVERVSGASVELRYLPLQINQSLMTGDPG